MKKIVVLLVLFLLPISVLALQKKGGPKETLWAKVTLHVTWNKRNENSGEVTEGVMNLSMSGALKLNRDFSGQVDKGRFAPLLSYALENATFNYNYKEDYSVFRSDNPPDCPNPQTTLQKTGSVSGDSGGAPMNLIIHYLSGLAAGASRLPIAPPPQVSDVLIDYYEFFVRVPAQKAEGKSKVMDSKTHQCKEIDQSDPIFDGDIKIFFKIGQGGTMSGSKSWSSQSGAHSFSVAVSDLPASFKKKPARPEPWGKNDVHYSLTWDLDSAPVAQIERETGGSWYDITGIDQEAIAGQTEVKLRGLVAPRSLDAAAGKWDIGNNHNVGPIKGFEKDYKMVKGIPSVPNVIALTSKDMEKKELTFLFIGEGESEVTYTVRAGGQDVTARVKFKVKKQASARESLHSTAGQETNE